MRAYPASEVDSGNYVSFASNVLLRSLAYRKESDALNVIATDLTIPKSRLELELSYTAPVGERKAEPLRASHPRGKLFPQRSYGCSDYYPGSNFELGACVDKDSRAFLWLQSFADDAPGLKGRDVVKFVTEFLAANRVRITKPVVFDLRSNGGGNLGTAQRIACLLGGTRVHTALSNLEWHRTLWPSRFLLDSGVVVDTALLEGMRKDDVDPTWEVNLSSPTSERRTHMVDATIFLKGGLSECDTLAGMGPKGLKYVLVAGGNEFSATETFLHLMSKVTDTVRIVGTTSRGGTGNPIVVRLPHTEMALRLSRQRQFDKETGTWIIEGMGVRQDVRWPRDFETDFERRILDGYIGDKDLESFEYAPMAIRKALALEF